LYFYFQLLQEMIQLQKIENDEQIHQDRELHDRLVKEREQCRYNNHYEFCANVVSGIVDLSTKIGEYREFTNK